MILYSMDDEAVFGPEFHQLTFSEAVEADILSDYKVLILTVDETEALAEFGDGIHDEPVGKSSISSRLRICEKILGKYPLTLNSFGIILS